VDQGGSDGECHCVRDLDRGEAVSLHHVVNWDRVSFRVSLLMVDERAAASLGVPPIATCPGRMPSVQLNRRDLGARGKQPGHEAMHIGRVKDPGNQQHIDTGLSGMIGHRAYIRLHHCLRPLIDPPRPVEPEGVNVDPLNEIRPGLGKLHQAPGGRGLANTRGSAQKHYAHWVTVHGSNHRDHQLNGAGFVLSPGTSLAEIPSSWPGAMSSAKAGFQALAGALGLVPWRGFGWCGRHPGALPLEHHRQPGT
jgi:hypothetical protein